MSERWVNRWQVPSSSGNGTYTVAQDKDGNYGCSCPVWKFRRHECKHIEMVRGGGGDPIVPKTDEEKRERRFNDLRQRGYRYLTWINRTTYFGRQFIESIKTDKDRGLVEDYKTVRLGSNNRNVVILVKNTPEFYQKEMDKFIKYVDSQDIESEEIKNPKYDDSISAMGLNIPYWITQDELREQINEKWFDLEQLILFNSSSVINPNLPEGSVYNSGEWGKKLVELKEKYTFLT